MRLVAAIGIALVFLGCSKRVEEITSDYKPAQAAPLPPAPTKLETEDETVGEGRGAKTGDTVHVQYTGTLTNGTKFDSSYDHGGEPFKFTLGKGEVIKGWDQGVVGMKVGGKRKLRIPAALGYGANGSPPKIPPDAGLVFEVELVSID
ncbi:MAG TPA: FKBP-type peptidyl-prolyl cis-trans isomerase [Polyangiaceae bacterium]|nr:FKBP-type peptidyl-prolyl cis-trans isomerase [Polyangiaceae bacterium]